LNSLEIKAHEWHGCTIFGLLVSSSGCDPPGRCISLAAGQELELQMCYSLAAREGSLADVDRWTGGQVDRCMEFVLRIEDLHDLPSRYMQTMFFLLGYNPKYN
jgi:hypothetical protein